MKFFLSVLCTSAIHQSQVRRVRMWFPKITFTHFAHFPNNNSVVSPHVRSDLLDLAVVAQLCAHAAIVVIVTESSCFKTLSQSPRKSIACGRKMGLRPNLAFWAFTTLIVISFRCCPTNSSTHWVVTDEGKIQAQVRQQQQTSAGQYLLTPGRTKFLPWKVKCKIMLKSVGT